MRKTGLIVILCICLCLLTFSAMAQEKGLPAIQISYAADVALSQEVPVEAQVVLVQSGQEFGFPALLRLDDENLDIVESLLPQKSLCVDGDDMRFNLYNGGNDGRYTMIISAVCSRLIAKGPIDIPVRAQEPVEVYLNGEYWGLYTRREDIVDAIVRFEGLEDAASLNVANVNYDSICGDVSSIGDVLQRIKGLELSREEDREELSKFFDTESFLNWLSVNSYFGTGNLFGEVIFYQSGNGPWKCAMGNLSYAFMSASANPFARLSGDYFPQFDAAILAGMMLEQPVYRDAFLAKLGALYQALPVSLMQSVVDAENENIASVLLEHTRRWSDEFAQVLGDAYDYPVTNVQEALLFQNYRVYRLRDKTLVRRQGYLYDLVQNGLNVSDEEMMHYFAGSKPELPEVTGDTWEDYKAANLD